MDLNNPEDLKLVTLARGARARIGAAAGAAVRDQDGRTYSGAAIAVGEWKLSALQVAIAAAVAAGAQSLEACITVEELVDAQDIELCRGLLQPAGLIARCSREGLVEEIFSA